MIESLQPAGDDPDSRHALLMHFPIVLVLLGVIPASLVFIFAILKKEPVAATALVCAARFAASASGFGLASGAGEAAVEQIEGAAPPLAVDEAAALRRHESLGDSVWLWALPAFAASVGTLETKRGVRITSGVLGVAASIVLADSFAVTGHAGGLLVYEHGLGIPRIDEGGG